MGWQAPICGSDVYNKGKKRHCQHNIYNNINTSNFKKTAIISTAQVKCSLSEFCMRCICWCNPFLQCAACHVFLCVFSFLVESSLHTRMETLHHSDNNMKLRPGKKNEEMRLRDCPSAVGLIFVFYCIIIFLYVIIMVLPVGVTSVTKESSLPILVLLSHVSYLPTYASKDKEVRNVQ